jgi:hypothetical protein
MGIGLGIGINRSNYAQGIFGAYQSRVVADGGITEGGACVNAVSSLLQSASLLLVPSGYKGGKAYAQIPTNGNGDLTWTRASTALRTNSSGLLESMGSGVPRLSYMYGSCPALLLEPQRTNLVLQSQAFDSASWSAIDSTVTANSQISPDGTQNAETMTISGSTSRVIQVTSIGSGTYKVSVYVKIISQTTAGSLRIFSIVDGNNNSFIFTPTTQWQRIDATLTPTVGITTLGIRGNASEFVGTIAIWGFQAEAGAYPTTYIPTTTASATRVGDSFSRNNIFTNGLITSSGGTWFVELRNNIAYVRDATSNYLYIGDSGTSGVTSGVKSFGFRNNASTSVRLSVNFYNGSASTSIYTTTADTVKIALKFNGTTMDVFENGVKVVSGASVPITLSTFEFLCGNAQVPQFIQAMALYPSPLSDTDCTTITTL